MVRASESDDPKGLHEAVSAVLRVSRSRQLSQKFSRVIDSAGNVAQSLVEEQHVFRDHVSLLLGGTPGTFETLVVQDRSCPSARFKDVIPSQLALCVPSPQQLAAKYRSLKRGKGFGEGLLCTDVFAAFPNEMSRLQFPLIVKSFVRIQPPLQWKGGMLHELFKGKGASSIRKNYRDILLSNDGGKFALKLIRRQLLPIAIALSLDTQYGGGLNGGETAFAHLQVRAFLDACKISLPIVPL